MGLAEVLLLVVELFPVLLVVGRIILCVCVCVCIDVCELLSCVCVFRRCAFPNKQQQSAP